jgi:hypothetical protein
MTGMTAKQKLLFRWDGFRARLMTSPFYSLYRTARKSIHVWTHRGLWDSWICSGTEKCGGSPFKLVYAGSKQNKNYILRTFFSEGASQQPLGARSPDRLIRHALRSGCDVIFFEMNVNNAHLLKGRTHFKIPTWIELKLDMDSETTSPLKSGSLANIRRFWKQNELQYTVTQDEKELAEFYKTIYVSFSNHIHQGEGFVQPYQEVLRRFRSGELLLASNENGWVGGVVLAYAPTEGQLLFGGMKNPSEKKEVMSSIFFQSFLRIKEKNLSVANWGYSHGFLRDGSFRYKARLGCRAALPPQLTANDQCWTLRVLKQSPALKSALMNHPFISLDETDAPWGIFFTDADPGSPGLVSSLTKDSLCKGLRGVRIYSWGQDGFDFNKSTSILAEKESVKHL